MKLLIEKKNEIVLLDKHVQLRRSVFKKKTNKMLVTSDVAEVSQEVIKHK